MEHNVKMSDTSVTDTNLTTEAPRSSSANHLQLKTSWVLWHFNNLLIVKTEKKLNIIKAILNGEKYFSQEKLASKHQCRSVPKFKSSEACK